MSKTCLVAAHDELTEDYFCNLVDLVESKLKWTLVFSLLEKPDVILYAGGLDVNTGLYGEKALSTTQKPNYIRDGKEITAFQYGQLMSDKDVWNIGICRGMQLLNILNGGKLLQHVEGHNLISNDIAVENLHKVQYLGPNRSNTFGATVNSYHHQMIVPPTQGKKKHNPYEIIVETLELKPTPEAIYFPKTRSLGVQWHPEWDEGNSFMLFKRIIDDYVNEAA